MPEPKIPGGCILLSRKLIESEIMSKPPLYLKVWIWLLLKAQHTDFKGLKRGQYKTSINEIIEAMAYKVGYRKEKPTKKEIFGIIDWLRNPHERVNEGHMMVTTKVTHGFVYEVVKYSYYQDLNNYEGNSEGFTKETRREQQGDNINKNVKNDKNKELKDICADEPHTHKFIPPTIEQVKEYCTERKNQVDAEKWHDFYTSKNWMIGKNKMKDWKAAVRTWEHENQAQQQSRVPNKGNFDQRNYTDSDFDKMFKEV